MASVSEMATDTKRLADILAGQEYESYEIINILKAVAALFGYTLTEVN